MTFYLLTFGCQMNRSDAERARTVLIAMGYKETNDENDPQIGIRGILACSVRQKAIDRVYGRVMQWKKSQVSHPVLSFVSGCILPSDRQKFLKLFDLVFPTEDLIQLPQMIRQYGVLTPLSLAPLLKETGPPQEGSIGLDSPPSSALFPERKQRYSGKSIPLIQPSDPKEIAENALREKKEDPDRIEDFWKLSPAYASAVEAYVPIQNGCDKLCSFCAVPYTRGREISRPSADILSEIRSLVDGGCKAITVLGQNVNSYGQDKKGRERSFPNLMRAIGQIGVETGLEFRTYFTSPHPRDMTSELLEVIAEYDVLAPWIHLPLQSGNDKVLLKMNRHHSMDRYRQVVEDIRRLLPSATLFTDIIVGFSGETEEQFESSVAAMQEFRYDMAYIAAYSPRPGAMSARWKDDVPPQEKKRRFHKLSDLLVLLAGEKNAARVGTEQRVLVTDIDLKKNCLSGYTEGRIPVHLPLETASVGDFVDLSITSCRPLSLEGRLSSQRLMARSAALPFNKNPYPENKTLRFAPAKSRLEKNPSAISVKG